MLMRNLMPAMIAAVAVSVASVGASAQDAPLCSKQDGKLTPDALRTVVIQNEGDNAAVFANDRFSFRETIQHILGTASGAQPGTDKWKLATAENEQITFLTSLLRSFHQIERTNNGVRNDATLRPNEADIQASKLLSDMRPVGLFNRLDLAPASWRYCGEHRVVYAMGTKTNRMFLIFEAAVDNPDPTHSAAGCLRIANFWAGLKERPVSELPDALHGFYYRGDLGDGLTNVASVLDSKHFGVPFGQIRGNLFMAADDVENNPWMLREWRTFPDVNAGTKLVVDTIKANPIAELFNDKPLANEHGRTQSFADLRPEFQSRFIIGNLRELIEVDLQAAAENRVPTGDEIFNKLSANFDDRFNDFESISQVTPTEDDNYEADRELKEKIELELAKYKLPASWQLTSDHIMNRAEALSCGGCHNLSNDVITGAKSPVGPGGEAMNWPAALAFTHIDEKAKMSKALLDHFLPARCENLATFVREPIEIARHTFSLDSDDTQTFIRDMSARIEQTTEASEVTDILPKLANEISQIRAEDARAVGAFRAFRRTH